ncbi:hypothetical protein PAPYR_5974 [Paratrimastix pyriformis]|uniref:Uncharacterized protein n=1 Tax=Paratrimastix pyriformis TaxID=342808 RepID=A0ABQ8UKR2_9EUKA|nr:hypothetical protein PAPYR_5974 [Paratrimastix pyriformis]
MGWHLSRCAPAIDLSTPPWHYVVVPSIRIIRYLSLGILCQWFLDLWMQIARAKLSSQKLQRRSQIGAPWTYGQIGAPWIFG